MMAAVKAGADRQDAHEAIRLASRKASEAIHAGEPNPLVALLQAEPAFAAVSGNFAELLDPVRYVGRAPEQVLEYVESEVDPVLEQAGDLAAGQGEVRV